MPIKFFFETITKFKYLIILFIFSNCISPKTEKKPDLKISVSKIENLNVNLDSIKIPIYTISKDDFDSILAVKNDNSKLTANIRIEDSTLDFTKKSSLFLFAFNKKGANAGDKKFVKYRKATISTTISLKYYPFLITNTEEKLRKIQTKLIDSVHANYKSLAFVPELNMEKFPDGSIIYSLIFVIYTSKETKVNLDKGINFDKMKLLLTKVVSLNPCPPARPADYR